MDIKIRDEEANDVEQVQGIVRAAFPGDAESKLVDALRENGKAIISLVAVNGDEVLGHILFSPVTTAPSSEAKGIGLAPVAVRRRGHWHREILEERLFPTDGPAGDTNGSFHGVLPLESRPAP